MKRLLVVAVAVALVTGCSEQKILCPSILTPGVAIEVRDAFDGSLIASGSKLVAQAGTYADSMSFPVDPAHNSSHLIGAFQPGVYTLTVTKTGYQPWVQNNVTVRAGHCGVEQISLTASLHAAP